ncbi:glutaminyl-tRNA synthetase [Dothidotthia symphoricarpi CBS 119687]|uniref:glutamine--tRNA ligase n=1 Tax=Dothidotthia symphoricarpi CBS 119687 TaxID=1392245 RepID=A0A6A6A8U0_9PLEO|nr:glutaminyl-tRNA synthetase [Dothidotthia symphoricarpi CBS 119687]KAF2127494.1 glutaminyl-tRNA synthetase [Dothidotthia symphoricarpi CBS 119687]
MAELSDTTALTEDKGPSKRALEKAAKKAAAKAKKAEHALRPKEAAKPTSATAPVSVFAEGWLKRVYEEKPVKDVRTRFPPEPNGFLHIGHCKAIAVDFGFAKHHNGACTLRYDDTNPEKEDEIYFTSILDSVKWLGFEPSNITYSSDRFDKLYELAEVLIKKDGAYVCHCSREEVNMQRGGPDNRGKRYACEHRTRPIDESIAEFRAMRDGKYKAGEAYLRMKQSLTDPSEGNPQMWDLPAYRVVENNHHHRTGDKWRIYPTYDFTHCICDALEGITHSLCTVEFRQSRISYDWLLEQLDMKVPKSEEVGPMQREFGRLSVGGTILSKRRILMLVEGATIEKKNADGTVETRKVPPSVRGWDDPRLFTLVAYRRRGIPAKAMLNFISELGVTDANTEIEPARFEASIRKHLERTVPRQMLVLDPVKVVIEDFASEDEQEITVPYDPKGTIPGERKVKVGSEVYIDRSDFREEDSDDYFRLAPNKAVGLYNVPFSIRATSFSKDESGNVTEIKAVKVPTSEKPKAYIQWVDAATAVPVTARLYNSIFKTESPNTLDWKTGGWADDLRSDSEVVHDKAVIERGLKDLIKETSLDLKGSSDALVRFQALRTAYFCVDIESTEERIVLNQIVSLREDKGK